MKKRSFIYLLAFKEQLKRFRGAMGYMMILIKTARSPKEYYVQTDNIRFEERFRST